ncbi:DUF465 domain-containing protein [Myxococcota bacterium]|nr:DUF465 domain-containing protein [Myxococcota bacterium]
MSELLKSELEEKLQVLKIEHQALDKRLIELEKHLSMTTEEQMEAARLKKQKLRKKDEMSIIKDKLKQIEPES